MEFSYELNKKDYYFYIKELKKDNRNFFVYLKSNIFFHCYILFICTFLTYIFSFFLNDNTYSCMLIMIAIEFIIIELVCIFSSNMIATKEYNSFMYKTKKQLPKKIIIDNENIDIYSEGIILSITKADIIKKIETKNYYSFIVDAEPVIFPVIIPKKCFTDVNKLYQFMNIINSYEANKKQKVNSVTVFFLFLTLILLFIIYKVDLSYLGKSNNSIPIETNVNKELFH